MTFGIDPLRSSKTVMAKERFVDFNFGMFADALNDDVASTNMVEKYFYCLWFGLKSLRLVLHCSYRLTFYYLSSSSTFYALSLDPKSAVHQFKIAFRSLYSSYGQSLEASAYVVDTGFSILSCVMGLLFFSLLIGNVQLGSTAIGLKTKEGVVLAVEKCITSPLLARKLHIL